MLQELKSCTCDGELCNRDWEAAGGTDQPPDTTAQPGQGLQVGQYQIVELNSVIPCSVMCAMRKLVDLVKNPVDGGQCCVYSINMYHI